jgi:hypothetical protein
LNNDVIKGSYDFHKMNENNLWIKILSHQISSNFQKLNEGKLWIRIYSLQTLSNFQNVNKSNLWIKFWVFQILRTEMRIKETWNSVYLSKSVDELQAWTFGIDGVMLNLIISACRRLFTFWSQITSSRLYINDGYYGFLFIRAQNIFLLCSWHYLCCKSCHV